MTRRYILALTVLLIAAWAWLRSRQGDDDPSQAEPQTTAMATTSRLASSPPPDRPRKAAAPEDANPSLPFPGDAQAFEIQIVDKESGVAVTDADVWWSDDTTAASRPGVPLSELAWQLSAPEQFARTYGRNTRSDERGRALVRAMARYGLTVYAESGARHGSTYVSEDHPVPAGHRIELRNDLTLRALVVDAAGAPAAGVPVGIAEFDGNGALLGVPREVRTGKADGIACFRHLQEWRPADSAVPSGSACRVRTMVPGSVDPGVAFDPRAPPAQPVVLRLPACGSVVVRSGFRGKALPAHSSSPLRIGLSDPAARTRFSVDGMALWMDTEVWAEYADERGEARFAYVPVGRRLAAHTTWGVEARSEFAGPATPGQEVAVTLTLAEDAVGLSGRLLDETGQPVGDACARVQLRSSWPSGFRDLVTDAAGRFLLLLGNARDQRRLEAFAVHWQRDGGPELRADLIPQDLPPGVTELGDLTLQRGPLLVAGRLLNGDKPYRQPVQVIVDRLEKAADHSTEERWRTAEDVRSSQEADGRFEVRGPAQPGRHRLRFEGQHLLPVAPLEFVPGTANLMVQLRAGHGLAASARVPPGLPAGLAAVLVPEAATTTAPPPNDNRLVTGLDEFEPGKARATWRGVVAGRYRMEVRIGGCAAPVLTIPDVQVPAVAPDPRLADIDLRERITVLSVRPVAAAGQWAMQAMGTVVFPLPQEGEESEWRGFHTFEEVLRLPVPIGGLDVLVCSEERKPTLVERARGEITVELRPWPEVELHLPDLPELPADVELLAWLDEPPQRNQGDRPKPPAFSRNGALLHPRPRLCPVVAARVRLPIDDLPHRLSLYVRAGAHRCAVPLVTPVEVAASAVPIVVRVPSQAIETALQELRGR